MTGRNSCNGVCKKIAFKGRRVKGISLYDLGIKKCNSCETFMKLNPDVINCPCCNTKLRSKVRSSPQRQIANLTRARI